MTFLYFLLMGIIQGVTEFVPVSSTGHLTLIQNLSGMDLKALLFVDLILHLGTLVTIVLLFYKDILRIATELISIVVCAIMNLRLFVSQKQLPEEKTYYRLVHTNYRKFAVLLLLSTVTSAIIGLTAKHLVTFTLNNLLAPGVFFMITGVFLLVLDYVKSGHKIPKEVTYADSIWIGICQGLAVFPGVSSLGITLAAAILLGLQRKFAVKYVIFLSVPSVAGGLLVELFQVTQSGMTWTIAAYSIFGAIVAGVVGFLVCHKLIGIVQRSKFKVFAIYNFCIGIVAIAANFILL